MKELTDELLNKYIDGELDSETIKELKELIGRDPGSLDKLKAHKIVDSVLRKLEAEKVPDGFTDRVMKKLHETVSVKSKKSKFFIWIIVIFILGIITIFSVTLMNLPEHSKKDPVMENFVNISNDFLSKTGEVIGSLFSSGNFLIVGIFLTFILLLSGFFMLNSHKSLMQKIENY